MAVAALGMLIMGLVLTGAKRGLLDPLRRLTLEDLPRVTAALDRAGDVRFSRHGEVR